MKNRYTDRKLENAEVKALLKEAFIYFCSDCNHYGFYDFDLGETIRCSGCLSVATREIKEN